MTAGADLRSSACVTGAGPLLLKLSAPVPPGPWLLLLSYRTDAGAATRFTLDPGDGAMEEATGQPALAKTMMDKFQQLRRSAAPGSPQ